MDCFNNIDVLKAVKAIDGYVMKTPLEKSMYLSNAGRNFYYKLECLQPVKSFKLRGAVNKISTLTEKEKANGVITISSGNHGIAVSYAAKLIGINNVEIIVPSVTPKTKIEKIEFFGGKVKIMGNNYDEAHTAGMKYISESDMTFVDAYDKDKYVYAGQGTVGFEIMMANPNIDTILVPIGGGGLITGISVAAKAINPDVKIIGVQTEACPAMLAAMRDKVFYSEYPTEKSICEALVGGIGELAYNLSEDAIDEILLVDEETIRNAVAHAINKEKIIMEPSSAVVIAAMMKYGDVIKGENIAAVISGGNIDERLMLEILEENSY